jgi:hypothetical protein
METTGPSVKHRMGVAAVATNHVGRLYSLALALVVFFLAWAIVAARPWSTSPADPGLKVLATREARLRQEAQLVKRVVARRWTAYRTALHARQAEIVSAKARSAQLAASSYTAPAGAGVRIVTLPPLTITRTS